MNILMTLCGRAGSKGVKGKNIRDFCGIPLVWYSLASITLYQEQYSEDNIHIVLNTDSEELIQLATGLPGVLIHIIHRNAALGGDVIPKVSVIQDCLNQTEERLSCTFDMVVDLDITSPLRTVADIRAAIEKKAARSDTDVVYSVTHARRNPYFNMVKMEDGYSVKAIRSTFTTRQQAPVFYDMNASIYAYAPEALRVKEAASFFNDRADFILMEDTGILDIDSEKDYELIQIIAQHLYKTRSAFREVQARAASWR